MWMRTTMNYQYRHGTTTTVALRTLWKQGGARRLYRGVGPALLQGPLARFGDTAANEFVLRYLKDSQLPLPVKTAAASAASASWRLVISPVDALKTTLQAEGAAGLKLLSAKVQSKGVGVLWHGALAAATATAAGHFPWFLTFNFLEEKLPQFDQQPWMKLLRSAGIGFTASVVSDTITNSVRVVKTIRQTYHQPIGYRDAAQLVVGKEGVKGLLGRGLKTRLLANGMQGLMFSVLWTKIKEMW